MTEQGKEEKNLEWAMGHLSRPRIMFSLFCQIEICTNKELTQFYILKKNISQEEKTVSPADATV